LRRNLLGGGGGFVCLGKKGEGGAYGTLMGSGIRERGVLRPNEGRLRLVKNPFYSYLSEKKRIPRGDLWYVKGGFLRLREEGPSLLQKKGAFSFPKGKKKKVIFTGWVEKAKDLSAGEDIILPRKGGSGVCKRGELFRKTAKWGGILELYYLGLCFSTSS